MRCKRVTAGILILTIACMAAQGALRTWTSTAGTTLEAEFVKLEGDTVYLKKQDGKTREIKKSNLCEEDQALIAQLSQTAAEKAPAKAPKALYDLLGAKLYTADEKELSTDALAGKKIIGLYFASTEYADFSGMLAKFYEHVNSAEHVFEVVYVSYDNSKSAMFEHMQERQMPWLAPPYSKSKRKKLAKQFRITGSLPFELLILDGQGNLITANGRNELNHNGFKIYDTWVGD